MATHIAQNKNRAQFEKLLKRWEARWRLRRIVLYLPRVLMAAIGIGIIVTLILGIFRIVSPVMMVGVVSGGIAAIVVLISGALGLFGKNGIEAARQFDKVFGLQERVSTAIELMDGRIQTAPELAELQVADAMNRAKDVDPRKHIKLEVKWLEWLGVVSLSLVLIIILGAYALIGSQQDNGASAATQTAVEQAAEDVRDITENVATNSALTDEERSNLLESLEVTLDDLSEEPATAEDSFVAMSELEADLSQLAEEISEEAAADSAALAAAAEALQNPDASNTGETAEDSSSLSEELAEMQEALSELTPEQEAELQQQLSAAAAALQEEFPELAQQLEDLAQNIQAGESNISEEELQQMLDDLAAIENDVEQRAEAAEALQEAAQQAQESAQDIAQSESQPQQGEDGQPPQDGQPQQSQPNQDGQQTGPQSQDGQPQPAQDGQPQEGESDTAIEGDSSGDANSPSDNPQSGQPQDGQPPQDGDASQGAEGGGAGDGEATGRQEGLSSTSEQSGGGNNPDGAGEIAYEEIYAPNAINTDGEGNVILEPDASDAPVVEGDFQDNPTGESSVPYNQVFRTYEDEANRALENDYVPLGMQDVVRDYFSSLQPTGDNP